jgi:hypothetical protein
MWLTFECDDHPFEYAAVPAKQQTRPGGPRVPIVMVVVRKPSEETGPAMLYPEGTIVTTDHAMETARRFWAELTQE